MSTFRRFGGLEEHQLFRVPLRGGTERRISEPPPLRIFDFPWSRKDEATAFARAKREFYGI